VRILGYVRVSKVGGRGGEAFHSPADQEQAIRDWAALHHPGARVVIAPHELDASGADANRPGWNAVLDAVCAREHDLVVVAKYDRAARDVRHLLDVIDRLRLAEVGFASVQENLDTTTPMGRLMATFIGGMAEWQRAQLRDGMAGQRANAQAAGIWCGQAPTGYMRDERRRLVLDAAVADRVREAYRMRVTGATWPAIARVLGASVTGARAIIRNEVYKGTAHVERLVSDELWQAAQPAHRKGARIAVVHTIGALRGVARCEACGHAMCVHRADYGCANALCTARANVSVARLDEYVRDAFADVLGSNTPLGAMMRERKEYGGALAQVREQIAEAQATRDAFAVEAAEAGLTARDTAAGLAARDAIVDAAHAELDRLVALGAEPLATIAAGLSPQAADLAERRADMAKVVAAVHVGKATRTSTGWSPVADRVRIDWRGTVDAVLPAA
jgi:DNA invertase Pin-like site-specific DNA recombinase